MIERPENIARVTERVRRYLHVDDGDSIKVAHRACKDFDDDTIEEALAYIDELLAGHPRRQGPEATAKQPAKAMPEPTRLPPDQHLTAGVRVRILGRAYEHIPVEYWKGFARWIAEGSLGERIRAAGDGVKDWYQVTMLSDEGLGSKRIKIVCSYDRSAGELVIYHTNPDMVGYGNVVHK
jgi:hypothetical protein